MLTLSWLLRRAGARRGPQRGSPAGVEVHLANLELILVLSFFLSAGLSVNGGITELSVPAEVAW